MKYVNNTDSEAPTDTKVDETLFDKTGSIVIGKKEKSYAKKISTTKNNELSERYYLKSHENVPYDPWGLHSHRETYLDMKFKSVSKNTFDYYMMYLKTKNNLYMTRCQRSFIND
jgi:hypothetical protein